MKLLALQLLLALCLFTLVGCDGVDRAQVEQQVTQLQAKLDQMVKSIESNKVLVDQLTELAKSTGNEKFAAIAVKIQATVAKTQAALPEIQTALTDAKTQLEQVKTDANGKIPWYYAVGSALAFIVPRALSLVHPGAGGIAAVAANALWSLCATRKQKDEEAELAAKATAAKAAG